MPKLAAFLSGRALVLCIAGICTRGTVAQPQANIALASDTSVAKLRMLFWSHDYEEGGRVAEQLVHDRPTSEVRAWRIVYMSQIGLLPEAERAADSLFREQAGSKWAALARAFALAQRPENAAAAVDVARRAYAHTPRDSLLAWLEAYALAKAGMRDQAVAFLDTAIRRFPRNPELFAAWGLIVREPHPAAAAIDSVLGALARGRAVDSKNVSVAAATAQFLAESGRTSDAIVAYEATLRLSPFDYATRSDYWRAVGRDSSRSLAERRRIVEADAQALLAARPNYPEALATVAYGAFDEQLNDRMRTAEIEARIQRDAPTSPRADMITILHMSQWMASINHALTSGDTARLIDTLDIELSAFISRPRRPTLVTMRWATNTQLRLSIVDPIHRGSRLVQLGRAALAYTPPGRDAVYVDLPMTLAERKTELAWAEQLIRARGATVQREAATMQAAAFATPGDFAEYVARSTARMHDQLGWVYFRAGRVRDARRELDQALDVQPHNAAALYHRGALEESLGHVADATRYYSKGFQVEVSDESKLSTKALRRLYAAKGGDTAAMAFSAYTKELVDASRAARRAQVLAPSVKRRAVPSFDLARLGGGRMSSADVRGKIAVVNVWGTWCGPCVRESPDLERFFEKYRNDSTVAFISIDADDSRDAVQRFMSARRLTFPVLLDDGWAKRADIRAFPTTLFIGPDGAVSFVAGESDDLVEEYTWRVEAMKARYSK